MNNLYEKYAELAVVKGANIQKDQYLIITCSVEHYEFASLCAKYAYKQQAKKVVIKYNDPVMTKLHYENVDIEVLKTVPEFTLDETRYYIENKCAYLHIISEVPDLLKDIDSSIMQEVGSAISKANEEFRPYTMNSQGQWSIVALPNDTWAKKVFPTLEVKDAKEKLLQAIFDSVKINEETNAIENWNNHNTQIDHRKEVMNKNHFKALHFQNDLGTDIVVSLNDNHIWGGGHELSTRNIWFNPNMPTEEIFTMPKRNAVDGIVYATKPLNFQGKLIDKFHVVFKDGKAISWDAKVGKEALDNLINYDEGSSYLGEVAIVEDDSPISQSNILFYNTLFDENASCHLALGAAYPTNMVDGVNMSKEELLKNNCNVSMTHVDFMFGSSCMNITGITKDNKEVSIFKQGKFII